MGATDNNGTGSSAVTTGQAIHSPLVGREAELQLLRQHVAQVLRGDGGIVSLVGEAGIGKSRLVAEAFAGPEMRPAALLVGRSLAVGQSLSFHPFTDLLRGWAGIAGGVDDAAAVAGLDEAVRAVCGAAADEIVPFVATLMGLPLSGAPAERVRGIEGEALERLVFRAVRALFQQLAAARPLVLFFEDVHWADRSSVQLIEQLMRLVGERPILFLLAFRPEHIETGQRLLSVARSQYPLQQRVVRLQPLNPAQSAQLVRNLLRSEHLPAAPLARIAEQAAGSPLFVEEVVRGLIDDGTIQLRDGQTRVTDRLESIAVPGSVRELIAARVERFDAPTQHLLQVASVIGRGFFGRVLAAIVGDDPHLDATLRGLTERGVLIERRTRRTAAHARRTFAVETEYVFQHALVQETIYGALSPERRRDLHARVAAAIEALFGERLRDFYGMLAYHYGRAERLEKAEEYLFKAGEDAARAAASSEALAFFREASRLYLQLHGGGGDAAKQARLERNIGFALMNTGRLAEAMPHFDRALAHLGDPIPPRLPGAVLQGVADAAAVFARLAVPALFRSPAGQTRHRDNLQVRYVRIKAQATSDPTRLVFDYCRAVRLLNETDPAAVPDQVIGLYSGFAAMFAYSGLSFRLGRRYLAIADRLRRPGHAKDRFDHDCLVCICNYLEGRWDDADGTVPDEVVTAALRHGGLWEVNTYLGLDADRRLRRGDFAGARRRIEQLADIAETYGFAFARTNQMAQTTLLLLEERQLDGALDAANLYHAGVEDDLLRVLALGSKAKAQVLLDDLPGAGQTLAAAERIVQAAPIIPPWHLSAYAVGRLHHDLAALGAAGEAERQSARQAAQHSARAAGRIAQRVAVQRGEIYRLTAHLHWLLGDPQRAARSLSAAIAECERLGARPELARAHVDASTWGVDLGDGRSLAAHLARARELFDACGLASDRTAVSTTARRAA
ncbi:MAG: ATP-binding protein [Candidatus Binatia bacterium]